MIQHKHFEYEFADNLVKIVQAFEAGDFDHIYPKHKEGWLEPKSDIEQYPSIVYYRRDKVMHAVGEKMQLEYCLLFNAITSATSSSEEFAPVNHIRYLDMSKREEETFFGLTKHVDIATLNPNILSPEEYFQESLVQDPYILQVQQVYNVLRANVKTNFFLSLTWYDRLLKDLKEIKGE